MMGTRQIAEILQTCLPFLYAALVALYGVTFFRDVRSLAGARLPALAAVIGLHGIYLLARTIAFDHPPITSVFEMMTVLAACVSVAYLYLEIRTRSGATGMFILFLSFLFQTASSLFIRDLQEIPVFLHSLVLGFHVSTALLGYTGITLSAVYGVLYLLLYHDIKASRFGLIYARLPNLETLEAMSFRAEVFGFWTLGTAIVIGLAWLPRVFAEFTYWDPKLIGTIAIWVLYAAGFAAKRRFGWRGRKMMVISLIAFIFVFFSMTVINLYLSGFHSFH
jgi:ABC-type transport system involved in cytochrome c biogenesis permease subunit